MATKLDELGEAIELLIGHGEEHFALEGPLRLFQFKGWLLDDRDVAVSFTNMGLLFTALALLRVETRAWKKSRAARKLMSPSERITSFLDSASACDFVDHTCRGKSLLDIASITWHPYSVKHTETDRKEIEVLNALTEWRMRILATPLSVSNKQLEPSVKKGLALLAADRKASKGSRTSKKKDPKDQGNAKRIRTARRYRESFLFAAAHGHEWMTQFDRPRTKIFDQMRRERREVDRLKAFFASAKAYLEILDKDAAKSLEKYWSALPATSLPAFDPLTATILASADLELEPRPRRPAETTKLAKRQSSTGSN